MNALHKIAAIAFVAVFTLASAVAANPAPARHPAYLRALADLREARAYIEHPDSGELHEQEKNAITEIDRAIAEIKAASIDDGKNLSDHPGVDTHLRWIGRLNKGAKLLDKAHEDVAKEEDDALAQGLQGRALDHIAKARRLVEQAIALEQ